MNNQLYDEVNLIINKLKPFFNFEELRETFSLDYIASNKNELIDNIKCLNEVKLFLDNNTFNFIKINNLKPIFNKLKIGQILEINEIIDIKDLLSLSSSFSNLKKIDKCPTISTDSSMIIIHDNLIKKINKIITQELTISDNATSELLSIRKELNKARILEENTLLSSKEKYKTFLSEDFSSIKNGFSVLPIKSKSISNVPGYIVSYSSTKETAYISPIEVLNIQNKIVQLENQELVEVNKIISSLSNEIKEKVKDIISNYKILIKWDRFFACFKYGLTYNGTIGTIGDKLELNCLFHPLIGFNESVKNSFSLSKDGKSMLFISGPNAGGKTVLLKATCIAIIMLNLSMLVPCQDISYFPYINNVVLISGDSQSIKNNLSTFSSHLYELKEIIDSDITSSFIAIDEICGGTSPSDGVALSYSIIDYLNNKKTLSMITSHFDELKHLVYSNKSILVCSMEFNKDNLLPTYHLLLNSIGYSYGIELAKKIGISEEIISSAISNKKNSPFNNLEQLTKKLNDEIYSNKEERISLQKKEKEVEEILLKQKNILTKLEQEKDQIKEKEKVKLEKEFNKKINQLNLIFSKAKSYIPLNKQIEIKTEIKNLLEDNDQKEKINEEIPILNVGDYVLDEDKKYYKVISIKKDKVILSSDGIKITRNISGLKKSSLRQEAKKTTTMYYKSNINDSLSSSLNVIGLDGESALKEYEIYLSRAAIKRFNSVKIIHGLGSYKLKNVLWKYLSTCPLVKSYRIGMESEGGLGATIVELK